MREFCVILFNAYYEEEKKKKRKEKRIKRIRDPLCIPTRTCTA